MSRTDTWEEVGGSIAIACLVIGPMWAAVVVLGRRAANARRKKTYIIAILAWAVTAGALSYWAFFKMNVRNAAAERARQASEQAAD